MKRRRMLRDWEVKGAASGGGDGGACSSCGTWGKQAGTAREDSADGVEGVVYIASLWASEVRAAEAYHPVLQRLFPEGGCFGRVRVAGEGAALADGGGVVEAVVGLSSG